MAHRLSYPSATTAVMRRYSWKLELDVLGGGLTRRQNPLQFIPPQGGYTESDTLAMDASLPLNDWHSSAEQSYFVRFNDGTFGLVNLEMIAGGDHFVVWESYIHPTPGSRNLEYDSAKEIKTGY